jgi:hypothetical protein
MHDNLYTLTTLTGDDNPSSNTVRAEISAGEWERFCARFVNGMVHQGHHQTGHSRPVGETTANRITGDLLVLLQQVGAYPADRKFDNELFHSLLRLDAFNQSQHPV